MESPPIKKARRVRYKGTHPRKFHEKYKELDPKKYADDIKKIESRGATAAGTHRPIMVDEIMEFLEPRPGQVVLDATLGFGGHSRLILEKLFPKKKSDENQNAIGHERNERLLQNQKAASKGKLIALDQDPIERPKTEARLRSLGYSSEELIVGAVNFRDAREFLEREKLGRVDLVLADLGLSSMQIDDPTRGFTFKSDGPFDLRMNPKAGEPAWKLLASLRASELEELLVVNSDEPHARQIAEALTKDKPRTTVAVAESVRRVIKTFSLKVRESEGDTPIRRVFQALRIEVNDEFGALDKFLSDLPEILDRTGRVAIMSFHSGEDRRVKKAFQAFDRAGIFSRISEEIVRPSFEEQNANPRSKSAKLRWGIKR